MNGRIVIELDDANGAFGVSVDVTGDLDTLQVIGLMEAAKLQHLQSKRTPGPTFHGDHDESPIVALGFDGSADSSTIAVRREDGTVGLFPMNPDTDS